MSDKTFWSDSRGEFVDIDNDFTVGDNIKRFRDIYGLTQEELADILDVTRESVVRWESNKMAIRDRHIAKLVELFGIEPDDIKSPNWGLENGFHLALALEDTRAFNEESTGRKVYNLIKKYRDNKRIALTSNGTATIPVVGKLHAGDPQDIEDVDKTMEVPTSVLDRHPKSYGWIVEGDCMDRVYPEGCMILIDTAMEPQDGSIGAVRLDGFQEVMRRVHKGANTLILSPESFNPDHEDIVITKDSETTVEFVGTVVWFQASEEME